MKKENILKNCCFPSHFQKTNLYLSEELIIFTTREMVDNIKNNIEGEKEKESKHKRKEVKKVFNI